MRRTFALVAAGTSLGALAIYLAHDDGQEASTRGIAADDARGTHAEQTRAPSIF